MELQNKDLRSNQEKLMTDLQQMKGDANANSKSNSALWANVLGVGAVFLLLSLAFNVIQVFVNQQVLDLGYSYKSS